MKHPLIALGLITLTVLTCSAQSPFHLAWHGLVNPHYYADSRAVVGGREDMMLFYPKPILLDPNGNDLNAGWQANLLAITARLGLTVDGPDLIGAHTRAYIEGDFTGATNATINNLRLRHAYINLDWGKHSLLMGQYWYAMVVHEIMPMTNPLNMGAPFHPYARQPQIRYTFSHNRLEAIAVAQWQLDNMSQGLLEGQPTSSTQFARRSLLPELCAQLRYRTHHTMFGLAANLKSIQPLIPNPESQLFQSLTWSFFGSLQLNHWTLKAQTLLNNCLYEGCSLGGYLLYTNTSDPTNYRAQNWYFNTLWFDIERTTGHWRPGLFLGYAKKQDLHPTPDPLSNITVLGRGYNMNYLWRIQPRLTYTTLDALSFTAEAEYTRAGYDQPIGNLRLSLSATYAF